jgi:small basic protein
MWAYAVVDHSVYSMPYIVALLVCIAVFSGLFLRVKPLRSFRKKRCLVVYAVMVLVAGLLVFLAYDAGLGPTYIGYNFAFGTETFQPEAVNQFNITLTNSGLRASSYYAVLTSINATFSSENPQDYIWINETAIKIPLSYENPKPNTVTISKPVFFKINHDATSFSVDINFEALNYSKILVTTFTNPISGSYNTTLNSYTIEPIWRATA